jgi:hypothetical protein
LGVTAGTARVLVLISILLHGVTARPVMGRIREGE